ncbi:MAG: efflux RND transporter periplasmic adaptor subunit [Planctomycetota bacterium]
MIFVLLVIAPSLPAQGGPPAMPVRLDPARSEIVAEYRRVTGEVRAAQRSNVAAEIEGIVDSISCEPGDRIEKGSIIATLDAKQLEIERDRLVAVVDANEAIVRNREAQLERDQRDLKRVERLMTSGGGTDSELDDAQTTVTQSRARLAESEADLAAAKAQLALVEDRIEDSTIRAPFTGRVVSRSAELGEWLGEGDTVIELVSLEEVDVFLDIPERFMPGIAAEGAAITLEIDAASYSQSISTFVVIPDVDPLARSFPVRIRIQNPSEVVQPGMSAAALVPTGVPVEGLTISKDALNLSSVGAFVYFDAGGTAAPAPVEVLYSAPQNRLVIRSPVLAPGMATVVEGNERLFPSAPIFDSGQAPATENEPATAKQTESTDDPAQGS